MDAVNEGTTEALVEETSNASVETERERQARQRVGGLVVLQLISRGYSLGYIAQLREETLAELVISLRDILDALGVDTLREGVREAQRRQLIV